MCKGTDVWNNSQGVTADTLTDINGKRVRIKAATSFKSRLCGEEELRILKYKEILNAHRIIKITKVDGEDYVEIVHDCLCSVIAKRREIRLAAEAKEREERLLQVQAKKMRKRISVFGLLAIIVLGLLSLFIWMQRENITEREAKEEFKNQRDAVQKQKDEVVALNESLKKQMQINQIQKDSLNAQLHINSKQKEELEQSLAEQEKLSLSLNKKNKEYERSLHQIKEQQVLIQQKDSIMSKYGICYTCNGTGRDLMGRVCSTCNGTGYISSSEITRNNSVIQLRKIHPKRK